VWSARESARCQQNLAGANTSAARPRRRQQCDKPNMQNLISLRPSEMDLRRTKASLIPYQINLFSPCFPMLRCCYETLSKVSRVPISRTAPYFCTYIKVMPAPRSNAIVHIPPRNHRTVRCPRHTLACLIPHHIA